MTKKLKFTIPLPPSVNALYQNQSRYNPVTGRYEITGQRVISKEGKKVKQEITKIAKRLVKENNWNKDDYDETFLYLDTVIYFNRRGRDADNIYKATQDAMQGVICNNDSQILSRTQRVMFDSKNPRVEITIYPVTFKGIFENKESYEEFESKCNGCSRYLNGRCSILKDSASGTVREEIGNVNNPECIKYKQKTKK